MGRIRRSSFAPSFLLPFALTVWLSACHRWVPARPPSVELPAQASMPEGDRDEIRILVGSERQVEGKLAALTGDSLTVTGKDSSVVLSVDAITKVYTREPDVGKSLLLGAGITAGALLLATAIVLVASGSDWIGY